MEYLIEIRDDLYDIANRLREIDADYILYRNVKAGRFEIHAKGALQTVAPFDRLDARTLEHARRTRIERLKNIIEEMDARNSELEKNEIKRVKERISEEVEKAL